MRIPEFGFNDVKDHMEAQHYQGNEYVTFLLGEMIVDKVQLLCSPDKYDAAEFCYEQSTDVDKYDYLPTQSVYRAMSWAEGTKHLFQGKDGLIDIADMVTAYHNTMEQKYAINNLINNNIMNEKNFDYLKDQVKFTGFGDALEAPLKESLDKKQPEFSLEHKHEFGKDQATAMLHFKQSDQTENYFFNSYDLAVKQQGSDEALKQTFFIGKDNNFTLKEAYNLLTGRAVNKDLVNRENEPYNAWVQLNFKETEPSGNFKKQYYNENYGFDLEKVLAAHPIKELANENDKKTLIESLQKGNRQSVTFTLDGNEQRRFIEASPKFKSINVYDNNNQRIRQSQKEDDAPTGQKEGTRKDSKQKVKDEGDGDKKEEKRGRSKKQGIS